MVCKCYQFGHTQNMSVSKGLIVKDYSELKQISSVKTKNYKMLKLLSEDNGKVHYNGRTILQWFLWKQSS